MPEDDANPLFPPRDPNEPWYLKATDIASAPARELVSQLAWPFVAGAEAWDASRASSNLLQDPYAQHKITDAALALGQTSLELPVRPAGSLGMFGGRQAVGADMRALDRAMVMSARDIKPESVWNTTGWWNAPGGDWKYEISDHNAKLNLGEFTRLSPDKDWHYLSYKSGGRTLGDILDHPELYAAYPQLRDMPVHPTSIPDTLAGYRGIYTSDGKMYLAGERPDKILSTVLHEAQHAVQQIENFPRGGTPREFLPPGFDDEFKAARDAINPYEENIKKANVTSGMLYENLMEEEQGRLGSWGKQYLERARGVFSEEELNNFKSDYGKWQALRDMRREAEHKYHMLAGEVESRAIQERRTYDPNERREIYPPATQGYPSGRQEIKRYDPGPNAFAHPGLHPMPFEDWDR